MFPTRSSLVKEPGHSPLPSRRFPQRRSGNLLPPVQLVNNFFFVPRNFFRSAIRFPFRRCRSVKLVRSAELVNSFFQASQVFFQTRNHSLPFVFRLPGGLSDCPIRSILSTTVFQRAKKKNRLVAGLSRRRVPATGTSIPQRRTRLMSLSPPLVNSFFQKNSPLLRETRIDNKIQYIKNIFSFTFSIKRVSPESFQEIGFPRLLSQCTQSMLSLSLLD